jgi:hypothetical protein
MVIETYLDGPGPVYMRAAERGRMLPDGLRYIDSWVTDTGDHDRCFQLMDCAVDDADALFATWIANWSDLVAFEIHPVLTSNEAAQNAGVTWTTDPN